MLFRSYDQEVDRSLDEDAIGDMTNQFTAMVQMEKINDDLEIGSTTKAEEEKKLSQTLDSRLVDLMDCIMKEFLALWERNAPAIYHPSNVQPSLRCYLLLPSIETLLQEAEEENQAELEREAKQLQEMADQVNMKQIEDNPNITQFLNDSDLTRIKSIQALEEEYNQLREKLNKKKVEKIAEKIQSGTFDPDAPRKIGTRPESIKNIRTAKATLFGEPEPKDQEG